MIGRYMVAIQTMLALFLLSMIVYEVAFCTFSFISYFMCDFNPFDPFELFEIYLQHKLLQLFTGSGVQNGATGSPLAGRLFVVIGAGGAGKALAYEAKARVQGL